MVKSGDFPTVVSPNPENAEALSMAIELAKKIDADIVMASDPDADRVGMACKDDKGEWVLINGNPDLLAFPVLHHQEPYRNRQDATYGFHRKDHCHYRVHQSFVADKNKIEMIDCYTGFKGGLPARSVCVKANNNTSVEVKKATVSLPKISFAIKMLFRPAHCWLRFVLGQRIRARHCMTS